MGIMGKIVGGTIGFALGGPLGAIAGAAFGHAFDKSEDNYLIGDRPLATEGENAQLAFFVAAFSMLAKLVRADGHVTREEIDSVENFMVRDLNLDPESRRIAMEIFHAALDASDPFESFATQFHGHFHNQPQLLDLMVDIMLRVALADGQMSAREETMIASAVGIFRMNDAHYQKLRARYISDVDKYYAILGCDRTDPDERIKSQYRKKVSEYHPDKIASKGLPDEFTKFANDKFREIQEAYDIVKKERGIR
jgi:DnaJ like chaperone protein